MSPSNKVPELSPPLPIIITRSVELLHSLNPGLEVPSGRLCYGCFLRSSVYPCESSVQFLGSLFCHYALSHNCSEAHGSSMALLYQRVLYVDDTAPDAYHDGLLCSHNTRFHEPQPHVVIVAYPQTGTSRSRSRYLQNGESGHHECSSPGHPGNTK